MDPVKPCPLCGLDSCDCSEVRSPSHYTQGTVETIEVIEGSMDHSAYLGYLQGNALKYLCRLRFKGKPDTDARKALWYLTRLIQALENGGL